jgi:hypothetical protein
MVRELKPQNGDIETLEAGGPTPDKQATQDDE